MEESLLDAAAGGEATCCQAAEGEGRRTGESAAEELGAGGGDTEGERRDPDVEQRRQEPRDGRCQPAGQPRAGPPGSRRCPGPQGGLR